MTTTTKIVRADHKRMFFNAWSVRRLQAGAKNQTRRIVKSKPNPYPFVQEYEHTISAGLVDGEGDESRYEVGTAYYRHEFLNTGDVDYELIGKPKYKPGNAYLVAEPLFKREAEDRVGDTWAAAAYQADRAFVPCEELSIPRHYPSKWTQDKQPARYCPRKFCRYAVRIEGVTVERVQEISAEDAEAEGIGRFMEMDGYGRPQEVHPVAGFKKLWNDLHGDDAWDENPFVWVYELSSLIEID